MSPFIVERMAWLHRTPVVPSVISDSDEGLAFNEQIRWEGACCPSNSPIRAFRILRRVFAPKQCAMLRAVPRWDLSIGRCSHPAIWHDLLI